MFFKGLIAAHIFISAFLIFFVQPIIAKALLPHYGSSAFVWIACMLFFQTGLFLGYGYAFLLSRYYRLSIQLYIHMTLVLLSFLFLPINVTSMTWIQEAWPPLQVLIILLSTLLVPFAVLSATSPLVQHWYCQVKESKHPYGYYSVSNTGSLIGLFCYPFLIELILPLPKQMALWSFSFVGFGMISLICTFIILMKNTQPSIKKKVESSSIKGWSAWLLLSFLGSSLLTASTFFITQNMLNIPLIWIIPLALYLISFIVTFSKPKGYEKSFWIQMFVIWLLLFSWQLYHHDLSNFDTLLILLILMYSGMMVCHGEVAQLKPAQERLTFFYLILSFGGVLGGIFVNLIAPFLFTQWWDLFIPLMIIQVMSVLLLAKHYFSTRKNWNLGWYLIGVFVLFLFSFILFSHLVDVKDERLVAKRNPYGLIQAFEVQANGNKIRQLTHGAVIHGLQFMDPEKQRWATTYYSEQSGVGAAFDFLHQSTNKPLRVAALGLGIGTVSTLTQEEDSIDYYEIDPDIIEISQTQFSFLKNGPGGFRIIEGDARLQLEKMKLTHFYDLIIVDAFSGDNIPFHLITQEAMQLYLSNLTNNGIVAFHISNAFIDLAPVTLALAQESSLMHHTILNSSDGSKGVFSSKWVLISKNPNIMPHIKSAGYLTQANPSQTILWTDNKNSVLPLLKASFS